MANDGVMRAIGAVRSYAKKINDDNKRIEELMSSFQKETERIGAYWDDQQYDQFKVELKEEVMQKIIHINQQLKSFADYTNAMCDAHQRIIDLKRK